MGFVQKEAEYTRQLDNALISHYLLFVPICQLVTRSPYSDTVVYVALHTLTILFA